MFICIDRDDIKPANAICELRSFCEEDGGGANQFSLLVNINRQAGAGEWVVRAVAHLDEHEAVLVLHNQVYLAQASSKILTNQSKALATQILEGEVLGV